MKLPKKWGPIISLVLFLGLVYMMYLDQDIRFPKSKKQVKKFEVIGSQIVGYDQGLRVWSISADSVWSEQSDHIFYMKDINSGDLYNYDGEAVVSDLKSGYLRANSHTKFLFSTGNVEANFVKTDTPIHVRAKQLTYTHYNRTLNFSREINLRQNPYLLSTDSAVYVSSSNILTLPNSVQVHSPQYELSANTATLNLDNNEAIFTGKLDLLRKADPDTGDIDPREAKLRKQTLNIHSDTLVYKDKGTHCFQGNVSAKQGKNMLNARRACFDSKTEGLDVQGPLVLHIHRLAEFLKEDISPDDPDVLSMSEDPVDISAQQLRWDPEAQTLYFDGNVRFQQETQWLRAQTASIDDENDLITLIGDVQWTRPKKDLLKSEKVIIDIKEQNFESVGPTHFEYYVD